MGYSQVLSASITLDKPGVIKATGLFAQGFSRIPAQWGYYLVIDGQVVFDAGIRTYPGDIVPIWGYKQCDAGYRTAELWWAGNGYMVFQFGGMDLVGFNNTSG